MANISEDYFNLRVDSSEYEVIYYSFSSAYKPGNPTLVATYGPSGTLINYVEDEIGEHDGDVSCLQMRGSVLTYTGPRVEFGCPVRCLHDALPGHLPELVDINWEGIKWWFVDFLYGFSI